MTKEEILSKWLTEPTTSGKDCVHKAMDEYALVGITRLLRNMESRPIQCYSQKVKGEDKKFFLGHSFIEDLILSIKKQYKNGGK